MAADYLCTMSKQNSLWGFSGSLKFCCREEKLLNNEIRTFNFTHKQNPTRKVSYRTGYSINQYVVLITCSSLKRFFHLISLILEIFYYIVEKLASKVLQILIYSSVNIPQSRILRNKTKNKYHSTQLRKKCTSA